jgi:intraflagellar transport protein 52
MKKEFKFEKIKQANIFIIGEPKSLFTPEEIEILKKYFEEGGNLLIMQGEGGDTKNNTNLNDFLKEYNIHFHSDSVVRTSYYKYLHPKECYIDTLKVHPDFLRTIKSINKKKKIDLLNNDDDNDDDDDSLLKIIYPFGQSIDYDKNVKNIACVFNSGIITYPLNRPLCVCANSKSGKGKLCLIGSVKFIDNDYIDKEENRKVIDGLLRWLLGLTNPAVTTPSKEVSINNYTYIPNIISLSEKVKSCLEEAKEPPRNFNDLYDMSLFKIDNNLVPEAIELYDKLNVKHEILSIIPPQFETPLPPLQLAVFDPIIKDFPLPSLELYDLDEQFANEKNKLAQITNKCNDEDLEYYIRECSDILGISGKIDNKDDPKAVLAYVMKELINYKKLNQ